MSTEIDVYWEQDIANQKGILLFLKHFLWLNNFHFYDLLKHSWKLKSFLSGGYVNETLPLSRQLNGCPTDTLDGITTCFCDEYCSWDVCRVDEPPKKCPMVSSWEWNSNQNYWFARSQGNHLLKSSTFFPNRFFSEYG